MTTSARLGIASAFFLFVLSSSVPASAGTSVVAPSPAGACWAYHVRVVRVIDTDLASAETAPVLPGLTDASPFTTAVWPDALATLRARGDTLLLLDRTATGLVGSRVNLRDDQAQPVDVYERRDATNESHKSSMLHAGAAVQVLTGEGLDYDVDVTWILGARRADEGAGFVQGSASWKGSCPPLDGRTLVLSHRQQVERVRGEAVAVEIYAFVSAQRVVASGAASTGS